MSQRLRQGGVGSREPSSLSAREAFRTLMITRTVNKGVEAFTLPLSNYSQGSSLKLMVRSSQKVRSLGMSPVKLTKE